MNKALKITLWVIGGILLVALFGIVTQYLWNWLMPKIFGLPALTLLETFGLLLLAKIIFGFGGKGGRHKGWHWREKYNMYNRFEQMTPEERQRFKARMQEKWCRPAARKEPDTPANG
jgi:hypothetical protein